MKPSAFFAPINFKICKIFQIHSSTLILSLSRVCFEIASVSASIECTWSFVHHSIHSSIHQSDHLVLTAENTFPALGFFYASVHCFKRVVRPFVNWSAGRPIFNLFFCVGKMWYLHTWQVYSFNALSLSFMSYLFFHNLWFISIIIMTVRLYGKQFNDFHLVGIL